jgi:hypothetical protein
MFTWLGSYAISVHDATGTDYSSPHSEWIRTWYKTKGQWLKAETTLAFVHVVGSNEARKHLTAANDQQTGFCGTHDYINDSRALSNGSLPLCQLTPFLSVDRLKHSHFRDLSRDKMTYALIPAGQKSINALLKSIKAHCTSLSVV